ncbi:MAG TPA: bifunctional folylpolyglutamate synthase/dihydrofolate synthase, partial [Cyanobacteria bacterium UBA11372]|nr:bifunctional folylpolyglutamate synthase/dihydrofolate synthase [Cyanobacteria bacterium UBA11372]
MTIDSILQPFQHFGVHLGLERIHKLLANLGNPHQQVPVIHVAGTNGKGSVCAYLSAVLTAAGYRVGRYTSPHLIDWNERICINEQAISLTELEQILLQVVGA